MEDHTHAIPSHAFLIIAPCLATFSSTGVFTNKLGRFVDQTELTFQARGGDVNTTRSCDEP